MFPDGLRCGVAGRNHRPCRNHCCNRSCCSNGGCCTNDVHTYIDGALSYDVIAGLKAELEEQYGNVLLVDAGNAIQGTAYGSIDKGESILPAYQIFDIGGRKIAFVGITTPESFTKSTPAYFRDEVGNYSYGISGSEDGAALYADVQAAVDAAHAEGANMVIDGETGEITTNLIGYEEILETVKDENGEVVLNEDSEEETEVVGYTFASNFELGTIWCSDAEVAAIQTAWIQEINTQLGQNIGSAAVVFDNYHADGNRLVRSQETSTGELSYLTAKSIHTFGNVACLQTITGQQLLDALEWGARSAGTGEECGGFLQVSGITYKIDSECPLLSRWTTRACGSAVPPVATGSTMYRSTARRPALMSLWTWRLPIIWLQLHPTGSGRRLQYV